MVIERVTLVGTLAADTYRSLADLFGFRGARAAIREGFLQVQSNGGTYRIVPRGGSIPATADDGTTLATGAAIGLGPTGFDTAHRLEEIWVRNTTAGSNARWVFSGVLDTGA